MFGSVGKKHRVIEAAPVGSPYAYLQAAVFQAEDVGALSIVSAEDQHSPTSDAATDTRDLSTHIEDERYKADLYKSIYERRSGAVSQQTRDHELLERGKKLNEDMHRKEDDASIDDVALEAHLIQLEQRLVSRSEHLRWGAVPEEQHPQHSSMAEYTKTRQVVLADKSRKAAETLAKEDAVRLAAERAEELRELECFCRNDIVVDVLIRRGLQEHEAALEARRDAELMALIAKDGDRREAWRLAQAEALGNDRAAREAKYVNCVDPVMRQMRQEAADRRDAERRREEADDEAELQALEDKLANLAAGHHGGSGGGHRSHSTVASTITAAGRGGGTVPYWKKQPVVVAAEPQATHTPSPTNDDYVMNTAATSERVTSTSHPPSSCAASPEQLVDAAEVSALLDVIDMAADDESNNGNSIGRGLGLLLSGIRV
jgi:hypothetical protein